MSGMIIIVINWGLILFVAFTLILALWKLNRGTPKPVRTGIEAIITLWLSGFFITIWNTDMAVWIWWLLVTGSGLVAAATIMVAAGVREERR